jgi:polyhydroxyalkanoate synthesis repressor PhaR
MTDESGRTVHPSELPLTGLRVGVTAAIPPQEHWGEVRDLDRLILSVVSQLTRFVLDYGGQIVHVANPLFTSLVAHAARRHEGRPDCPFTLLTKSQPEGHRIWDRFERGPNPVLLTVEAHSGGSATEGETQDRSAAALAVVQADMIDVLIAVGGSLHREVSSSEALDHLALARWRRVPCFVLGGLDRDAPEANRLLVRLLSAGNRLQSIKPTRPTQLAGSDLIEIDTWDQCMDEQVSRVLVHLADHRRDFVPHDRLSMIDPSLSADSVWGRLAARRSEERRPVVVDAEQLDEACQWLSRLREALHRGSLTELTFLLGSQRLTETPIPAIAWSMQAGKHVIKRYSNRKLYDTRSSRYVTLQEIAALIREGAEIQVLDKTTGQDLTAATMAQIIFEEEKRTPRLPLAEGVAKLLGSRRIRTDESD